MWGGEEKSGGGGYYWGGGGGGGGGYMYSLLRHVEFHGVVVEKSCINLLHVFCFNQGKYIYMYIERYNITTVTFFFFFERFFSVVYIVLYRSMLVLNIIY